MNKKEKLKDWKKRELEKLKFRREKDCFIQDADFDYFEATGQKLILPIPLKICIALDRMFEGHVNKDGIYRLMVIEEISFGK
jgi:hypothetical protein